MADPFVVPKLDFSWLSNLPQSYEFGRQSGREDAMRREFSKIPVGPSGEPDFGAMMKVMAEYGEPQDVARMAMARAEQQATAGYRAADLGLQRARLGAEYPWADQGQPQGTQVAGGATPTQAAETPTDRPRPRSMGELAADKKYAGSDYLQWQQGGFSETEQNLKSLQHVKDMLEKDDSLSGPVIGALVKKSMSGNEDISTIAARQINTEAFNMAAAHQRAVVASLRPLVGARAAQQLFQSVLQTTYDPSAEPKENARRIGLVMDNIRKAAEAKQKMSEYFTKYGTLSGYKGPKFDPEDFDPTEGVTNAPSRTGEIPVRKVQTTPIAAPSTGTMPPIPEAVGKARRAFEMGHSLADIKAALEADKVDPQVVNQIMQALQGGPTGGSP